MHTSKCAKVLQPLASTALLIHNPKFCLNSVYLHYAVKSECYNTTK